MAYLTGSQRPIVFRLRGETLALLVGAFVATFALSNAIHARREPPAEFRAEHAAPPERDWTGDLADPTPFESAAQPAPFTSASLVVPRSDLALPPMPAVRPLVRLRGCQGSACVAKANAPRRAATATQDEVESVDVAELAPVRTVLKREPTRPRPSLVSRMNPLGYIPGMAVIKRPFAYAGETVTGWFRRF